jgi:hypothetical protein
VKSAGWIYILFGASLLLGSCKKTEPEVIVLSIPEENRFIFESGDTVTYISSDASSDTIWVRGSDFYTEALTEKDFFGIERSYRVDHLKINLEVTDTTWLDILHYACYNPEDCNTCVNIETSVFLEEDPTTMVYFGCEPVGGLVIAESSVVSSMYLNDRIYYNVYFCNYNRSSTEGFRMYWSLKYGIIRFEGESGETLYAWDLETTE